jgi:hypothetical protein
MVLVGGGGRGRVLVATMVAEKKLDLHSLKQMKYGRRRYNKTPQDRAEERKFVGGVSLRSAHTWISIT